MSLLGKGVRFFLLALAGLTGLALILLGSLLMWLGRLIGFNEVVTVGFLMAGTGGLIIAVLAYSLISGGQSN